MQMRSAEVSKADYSRSIFRTIPTAYHPNTGVPGVYRWHFLDLGLKFDNLATVVRLSSVDTLFRQFSATVHHFLSHH